MNSTRQNPFYSHFKPIRITFKGLEFKDSVSNVLDIICTKILAPRFSSPMHTYFRPILDALLDSTFILDWEAAVTRVILENVYVSRSSLFSWILWKSWRLYIKMYQTAPVDSAVDYINSQILLKNVLSSTKYSKVFFEQPTNSTFSTIFSTGIHGF